MDPVIRVEGLGKRYRIGEYEPYGLLRDSLGRIVQAPFRRLLGLGKKDRGGAIDADQDSQWIWALRNVSFEVDAGEAVGIVGRNGAGKSTLLKILSRVTSPTAGRFELRGRVASLLEVGTGFHPELTGRENVYLNGAILGMPRGEIAALFDEIVDYAEVQRFIDTPIKFYSSGMKVRLGFAVAIHLRSEILIIDEVLSVGDLAFRRKSFETIDRMSKLGQSVLIVTHNISMLSRLVQRCLYIQDGAIRRIGPTDEVLALYRQDLLSEPDRGSVGADVPRSFQRPVENPVVAITNVSLCHPDSPAVGTLKAGKPAILSLELTPATDLDDVELCVYFFHDGQVIRRDHSRHHLGRLSLKRGERYAFEITYPRLPFRAGDLTAVVFVAPSGKSTRDTLSEFKPLILFVKDADEHGGGLVRLEQSWNCRHAAGAEPKRASRAAS